ncbi:MAG: NUDIX hydrolase [Syntrophobacteraceae bacterium]|nr:NUDIX hydrolase [Syntrophobacteraceae bacterium]
MDRRYPRHPMVGVGAIVFRADRVLLIQRGREPALGKWSIPGGLVELGETLEEAVIREVWEETGLHVRVADLVAALDRVIRDEDHGIPYHYVLLDFLCHCGPGEPRAGSDVTACRFVPLDALPAHDLTEGTEKVLLRAFSLKEAPLRPVYDPNL